MPTRQEALAALDLIADPKSGRGLVQAGLVQGLVVDAPLAEVLLAG